MKRLILITSFACLYPPFAAMAQGPVDHAAEKPSQVTEESVSSSSPNDADRDVETRNLPHKAELGPSFDKSDASLTIGDDALPAYPIYESNLLKATLGAVDKTEASDALSSTSPAKYPEGRYVEPADVVAGLSLSSDF